MTRLPEPAPEPRHRGGAGGVRPRKRMRRSEQTIDFPERVYRGPHYSDAFKKAWAKMAALDVDGNIEHCNASVANMAAFTGLSKSAFERALKEGRHPGPDGGAPEFTTRRMTHRGGCGRTAIREVRPVACDERYVTVPMWIADAAEPRELAAVLLIAHAADDRHALTAEELAGELFHHHGKRQGQPLSERTVRRLIDRCEGKGFLDVDRRSGYQGRHVLTVRDTPLQAAPEPVPDPESTPAAPAPCPDNHDGSGPDTHDGSLAIKEYKQAVTDEVAQVGGAFRRRRGDRKWVADSVDTAGNDAGARDLAVPATFRPTVPPPRRPYDGPPLTLSPRVWAVLEPVADLLPAVSDFAVRRIAREIGRQLDTGIWAEEIRDQIARLRRWTPSEDIPDPGRWLLGAVLPVRSKCGKTGCHWGFLAYTGEPCKDCAEIEADRARTGHPPHTGAWHECTQCQKPARHHMRHGLCPDCA
ncbi:MAG: hypothetical protein HOV92_37000 [Streptomyces sp.]|nr:hypothetical protein [Streptomyces sp.]